MIKLVFMILLRMRKNKVKEWISFISCYGTFNFFKLCYDLTVSLKVHVIEI
jgi:hypothetical protein